MTHSTIDIYKLLPKTNCKECRAPSCLAFAALMFKGEREIEECPYVNKEVIGLFKGAVKKTNPIETDREKFMESLKQRVANTDLESRAKPTGGSFANNRLTIKIMGKDFSVDSTGKLFSDIHVNPWIAAPFLTYVLETRGLEPTGTWVPFRELAGGKDWYRLFGQRCEKPLKQVADNYPALFADMIDLFNGKPVENHYQSDISLVLHPLPRLPMLICYWKPEEELGSELNLFFDRNAEENLNIEGIYGLATGLVTMFEKIALKHGIASPCPAH
ncbi:MAG: DUF3786 domain-containing protein [Desulfobacteraceae bacterium]|nr:DUF3786 domain-containing protein [Desulfobacteraceae bacterium]